MSLFASVAQQYYSASAKEYFHTLIHLCKGKFWSSTCKLALSFLSWCTDTIALLLALNMFIDFNSAYWLNNANDTFICLGPSESTNDAQRTGLFVFSVFCALISTIPGRLSPFHCQSLALLIVHLFFLFSGLCI